MANLSIEEMATFCKRKGIVYPSSDIYGGLAGFWDFGPYGVEIKNSIKREWWQFHVQSRPDIVGIDGSIITHPKVWEASGHVASFADIMLVCTKCRSKIRADHFIEDSLKVEVAGMKPDEINSLIMKHKLRCPACKGSFEKVAPFNLMFTTHVGPSESASAKAYLRPETAQVIFADFKLIAEHARLKLPFGIAQIGKAFRNEISPRDFLFRCREFEQMEIEYFIHPEKISDCPFAKGILGHELLVYSEHMQENKKAPKKMSMQECLEKKIIKTPWHAYWLALEHQWFISLGANPENFRIRQHVQTEKSHYALDTWDLEYSFPFGWKELQGIANRTDFDLNQHMKFSGVDLSLFDEETKKKVIPYVVCEPSLGVERAFLVFMFDAYADDKKRGNIILKLHPKLAPIKAGIFPLVNKLNDQAQLLYHQLKSIFHVTFDKSGSIGRRYARADELGIPYCITVDFDTEKDRSVTIRDRDTTRQIRVKLADLQNVLFALLHQDLEFEKAGTLINA